MSELGKGGDDPRGLAAIYREHVWEIYGFFAYRLGNPGQAEDLTQATFERAVKAFPRYDPARAQPKTWLLAIGRNLLIDHYRADRSSRQVTIGEHGVDPEQLPDPAGGARGEPEPGGPLAPDLAAAMRRLSKRDREVVALRYGADMTGPEIAEILGLTLANVQQIISRSLRRLRAELETAAETRGRLAGGE